jgi:glucose-6-phosphate isomerase
MNNPQVRYLKEMTQVVYDKDFAKKNPVLELYYVYRGIKKENEIRYDITAIPPQMLGQEFVRTKGNRNSNNFGELYTVLRGEAVFLVQRSKNDMVEDVYVIKAKRKDYILLPAECSVIIINTSRKELRTGNWVSEKNENVYKELEKMGGMCYFAIAKKSKVKSPAYQQTEQKSKINWVKNNNYKKIPKLRFKNPLKQKPKSLDFLKG